VTPLVQATESPVEVAPTVGGPTESHAIVAAPVRRTFVKPIRGDGKQFRPFDQFWSCPAEIFVADLAIEIVCTGSEPMGQSAAAIPTVVDIDVKTEAKWKVELVTPVDAVSTPHASTEVAPSDVFVPAVVAIPIPTATSIAVAATSPAIIVVVIFVPPVAVIAFPLVAIPIPITVSIASSVAAAAATIIVVVLVPPIFVVANSLVPITITISVTISVSVTVSVTVTVTVSVTASFSTPVSTVDTVASVVTLIGGIAAITALVTALRGRRWDWQQQA